MTSLIEAGLQSCTSTVGGYHREAHYISLMVYSEPGFPTQLLPTLPPIPSQRHPVKLGSHGSQCPVHQPGQPQPPNQKCCQGSSVAHKWEKGVIHRHYTNLLPFQYWKNWSSRSETKPVLLSSLPALSVSLKLPIQTLSKLSDLFGFNI